MWVNLFWNLKPHKYDRIYIVFHRLVESLQSFLKNWPNSTVCGSLHTFFKKSDQIGGPWIPAFPFQNLDRFARGSLHPLLKNWPDSTVRGSLHTFLKKRTKSAVYGSLHPLINSNQNSGPLIPAFPFQNLDRFARPWNFA